MSSIAGNGQLLRVFLGEADRLHGRPLYEAIVYRAREMGLAGATVVRAVQGFGANSVLHTTRLLRLSDDLPIIVEVVDREEKIAPFVDAVEAMLDEADCGAMITIERATVIRYQPQRRHRD